MSWESFIDNLDALIQAEQARFGQDGVSAEAYYSAAVASHYFEKLQDKDIGLIEFEACSFSHGAGTTKGEAAIQGYYLEDGCAHLHLFSVVPVAKPGDRVTPSVVNAHVDKALRFLKLAESGHHREVEESREELISSMRQIYDAGDKVDVVRVFVFTTGQCPKFDRTIREEKGRRVEVSFYDAERLFKAIESGVAREPIQIDLVEFRGEPIPVIHIEEAKGQYDSYMGVIDGGTLAKMYTRYSSRLIEQNVRMFLQARGKVNAGIQSTIRDNPGKFLAYNNGLSLTATKVEIAKAGSPGTCLLKGLTDLQIVNGAQTTGSIYHAQKREGRDVSGLNIQFKLTVPKPGADVPQLVSDISKYSNSQNAVKVTDLKANQPYHIEVEAKSRTMHTPLSAENTVQTRWFYERARGAYLVEKVNNPSKIWQRQNPESQMFTKVDLGKSEVPYWGEPHMVSRGGEKNFVHFMERIESNPPLVQDQYFKEIVARLILFRQSEVIVQGLKQGGYRANVVAYSLAYIYQRTANKLNWDMIWSQQAISKRLAEAIALVAAEAFGHVTTPPANVANVGEWAKKVECWNAFESKDIKAGLGDCPEISGKGVQRGSVSSAIAELRGNYQRRESWEALASWARQTKQFDRKDLGLLDDLASGELIYELLEGRKLNWANGLAAKAEGAGFAAP